MALLLFFCVFYMSCSKSGKPSSCSGVICENGGYCNKGKCVCPLGYESANCGTASVAKFINTWDVTQTIIGSNRIVPSQDSSYILFIEQSATPTTFFINNFYGNPYYNNVICILDTLNTSYFRFDTNDSDEGFHMINDGFYITGGKGYITLTATDTFIIDTFYDYHKATGEIDTVAMRLTPYHF